jgi:hypothetical protein
VRKILDRQRFQCLTWLIAEKDIGDDDRIAAKHGITAQSADETKGITENVRDKIEELSLN